MRANIIIYNSLVDAPKLEDAVRSLSDEELRSVRGALARGDINSWPAELVHGVCMAEGCERFMKVPSKEYEVISEQERDAHHGAEVGL